MKKIFITLNLLILICFLSSFNYQQKTQIINFITNDNIKVSYVKNSNLYHDDIKKLLLEVNVDENLINSYDQTFFQEIKTANNIYITTENVPNINLNSIGPNISFDCVGGGGGSSEEYESELTDEYMNITYIVTDFGNSSFKFYIDAVWLKMPVFRLTDSLGATCMNMTVINGSRDGYIKYEIDNSGKLEKINISENKMSEAANGNWYGSACKFSLSTLLEGKPYTKFQVHYEYEGHFNGNNDNPYINTTATYSHQRIALNFSSNIDISLSGTPHIGIIGNFLSNYEYRTVSFPYDIKVTV